MFESASKRRPRRGRNELKWDSWRCARESGGNLENCSFFLFATNHILFDCSVNKNDSRKKKGLNEVRQMDYQIGRFKDGVQYLNKEDIGRLKRRK